MSKKKNQKKSGNGLLAALLIVGIVIAVLLALNLFKGGIWIIEGLNGRDGVNGINGVNGADGADGANGKDGQNGKNAYELACENGFQGSLHEWLLSLAVQGGDGKDGADGQNGKDAVGIRDVKLDADGHLIVTLTDGTVLDAGYVGGDGLVSDATDAQGFFAVCETVVMTAVVDGLNLRSMPEITDASTVLFEILPGTELLRVGDQKTADGFSRFVYQGKVCYARSKYFELRHDYDGEIPAVHLPAHVVLTVGKENWFYTDQILGSHTEDVRLNYSYSGNGTCVSDGGVSFAVTPSGAEEATLVVRVEKLIDGMWRVIGERSVAVSAVEVPTSLALKGILIGDSRISDNTIASALSSATGGKPALTLMGTRRTGSSTVSHEGRSGWSTAHFLNNASLDVLGSGNAVPNAFYNPETGSFDFSYYMTTQGFDVPDFVVINLGANDNFSRESVDRINLMAESIKAYATGKGTVIRILVMTEYLSPAEKLGVLVNVSAKREKQFQYFTYLDEVLADRESEGIYLLPNYLCIDGWNDWKRSTVDGEELISDVVHLGYNGYYKEEQMIRAYLYWLFGA